MEKLKGLFLLIGIVFFFFVILQWGYEMTRRTCYHAADQLGSCDKAFICAAANQSSANEACEPRWGGPVFKNSPIANWFSRSDGTAVIIESKNPLKRPAEIQKIPMRDQIFLKNKE